MIKKLFIFLVLTAITLIAGCLESSEIDKNQTVQSQTNTSLAGLSEINKSQGIYDNANRLYGDYNWKLDLVTEIQKRTDALGTAATKEMYIEWKLRNNEAIEAGERLATYITENRNTLNQYWTSDILVLIAKNKVTFERDNQALEQKINLFDKLKKLYAWRIDYYGREGSEDLGTLIFENQGLNLSNVKFRFEFYNSGDAPYSQKSLDVGDVASDKTIRKKVSLPSQYSRRGEQLWSKAKLYLHINGTQEELWIFEDEGWRKEQPIEE